MKITTDDEILYHDFYNLFNSYDIKINDDYKFFYEKFFEHILEDTNTHVEKNFRIKVNAKIVEYKRTVFRSMFYQHFVSKDWHYKLRSPESFSELRRIVRKNKLEKINTL